MRRTRWVAAGAAALAIGWAAAPAVVPLYDGVGFPDEPYRYVGGTGKVPGTASVSVSLSGGANDQGLEVTTDESGPQANLYIPTGALTSAGGASTAVVTVTPEKVDVQPGNGPVTGNVYRIGVTSGGTAEDFARPGTITLRAPVGFTKLPVIDYRAGVGQPWREVETAKVGNDIFQTTLGHTGDYATVLPTHGSTLSGGGGSHTLVVVLVIVAGLGIVALVVVRGMRAIGEVPEDWEEPEDDAD